MRFFYTLVFTLLLPVILIRLLLRSRKAPAYRRRILERFGLFKAPKEKGGIWFHTVSVGEFLAAAPLIEQVMAAHPDQLITVTTTTPTGSEQVVKRFGKNVFHVYLPYDIPLFLAAFLQRIQPELLVILETELWPNLLVTSKRFGCTTALVNARLSEKSAKGYAKVSGLTQLMLKQLDWLAVQSEADANRFLSLGMNADHLSVVGSIKFDVDVPADMQSIVNAYRNQWGRDRPVWIMASTHEGEDNIALEAHRHVLNSMQNALLVLVPRHPERFESVATMIESQDFRLARRTQFGAVDEQTQVLLLDSMGELMPFLAASDVVCMGGSFVENGGHNPLEAAALAKPVLMGPSQFNFETICKQLTDCQGMTTVQNTTELPQAVLALLENAPAAKEMGRNALTLVQENRGAKQKLFEGIGRLPVRKSNRG